MITIIITIALALILASVVLVKSRTDDPDQLFERRPPVLMMGVQIICGDCSGENHRAKRTYLDLNGHCAQCGGSSYVLASLVAYHGAETREERVREEHAGSRRGRVIPFKAPVSRASHSKKIAM